MQNPAKEPGRNGTVRKIVLPATSDRTQFRSCKQQVSLYSSTMTPTAEMTAFDRGVRPMAELLLPDKAQAILGFRPPPELQARIEELAEKSTEGQLTEVELEEYAGYVQANKFVAILKRLAREVSGQAA